MRIFFIFTALLTAVAAVSFTIRQPSDPDDQEIADEPTAAELRKGIAQIGLISVGVWFVQRYGRKALSRNVQTQIDTCLQELLTVCLLLLLVQAAVSTLTNLARQTNTFPKRQGEKQDEYHQRLVEMCRDHVQQSFWLNQNAPTPEQVAENEEDINEDNPADTQTRATNHFAILSAHDLGSKLSKLRSIPSDLLAGVSKIPPPRLNQFGGTTRGRIPMGVRP